MAKRHDTSRTDDTEHGRSKQRHGSPAKSSLARLAQHLCWRTALHAKRSRLLAALLALVLSAAALLATFNTPTRPLQSLSAHLRRTSEGDPRNSAAALLDGRATVQSLPQAYPNGAANVHRCDLPSLRYQCDQDSTVGCRAYPQLFPTGELLKNWSPDKPKERPEHIFSSICRFNVSIPYELELAQVFHQMEVPFISYGIPALDLAATRWTNEHLAAQLQPNELYKVHIANNSHFMYYSKTNAKLDEPPTYASEWWTYAQFADAVAQTKQIAAGAPHPFYYLMLKAQDIKTRASFILNDLDFLDPERVLRRDSDTINSYANLFIRDAQDSLARGMRCRFGMEGIITEGHIDSALNMIAMVRGAKRYVLSPPSACSCLELLTTGASARHTRLNWSDVAALPPQALACPATEVVVGAGDVLYVPSYWYHHIVSLDESIQCNVRSGTILRPDVQSFLSQCGFE